ncbi:hypothetical protein JCM16358_22420 [Halanaerocella petrolearia]
MKIDYLFTWSKNEEEDLKAVGGGFKVPAPFKWVFAIFKK